MEKTKVEEEIEQLLENLEIETNWDGNKLCLYQGYWNHDVGLKSVVLSQRQFVAHDTDIILATLPKSGTTWLKALCFAILNRNKYTTDGNPVRNNLPHALVPSLGGGAYCIYAKSENPDISYIDTPRLFSTHMQTHVLPKSIWDSNCKIIYNCRNPSDLFVSYWYFWLKSLPENKRKTCKMDEALDIFFRGVHYHGPFWDHVLGYWNASLKYQDQKKVLFLKYEELKEDTNRYIREITEFVGFPFSVEEDVTYFIY